MAFTAIVFDADPRRPWFAARSARSVRRAGAIHVITVNTGETAPPRGDGPVVLLRAGAWLRHTGPLTLPPPNGAGQYPHAIGLPLTGPDLEAWHGLQRQYGGDF